MEITIYTKHVEIKLKDLAAFHLSWDALNKVEKAIEIIRNIQATAPIESARITTA